MQVDLACAMPHDSFSYRKDLCGGVLNNFSSLTFISLGICGFHLSMLRHAQFAAIPTRVLIRLFAGGPKLQAKGKNSTEGSGAIRSKKR